MDPDPPVEALRNVPLFAELDEKDLEQLARQRRRAASPRARGHQRGLDGRRLLRDPGGNADVSVGGEHRATLGPGDHFGEIALIDDGTRSASIVAATDLLCYRDDAVEFRPFVEEYPQVAWALLRDACPSLPRSAGPPTSDLGARQRNRDRLRRGRRGARRRPPPCGRGRPPALGRADGGLHGAAPRCPPGPAGLRRVPAARRPFLERRGRPRPARRAGPRPGGSGGKLPSAACVLDFALAHQTEQGALVLAASALGGREGSASSTPSTRRKTCSSTRGSSTPRSRSTCARGSWVRPRHRPGLHGAARPRRACSAAPSRPSSPPTSEHLLPAR